MFFLWIIQLKCHLQKKANVWTRNHLSYRLFLEYQTQFLSSIYVYEAADTNMSKVD